MKTEIVPLADFEAARQFCAEHGITLTTEGGASFNLEVEGKGEQHYVLRFGAKVANVTINNARFTPHVELTFTALRVVG